MKPFLITVLLSCTLLFFTSTVFEKQEHHNELPPSYVEFCANCHGMDLRGGNAQSLLDGIWQFGNKKSYLFRNIKFGIPHLGMPSYEASLSDDEINTLIDFLLNEEVREGVTKPPLPTEIETQDYKIQVEVYAENLEIPWSIDFINKDIALITERGGRLRMVEEGVLRPEAIKGTPEVLHEGQGGLMDVAIDPNNPDDGWIYLAYSHVIKSTSSEDRPPSMTRIVRGKINDNKWVKQEIIFEAPHDTYGTTRHHYGSRIVFDPEGYLYFSIGDRGTGNQAQQINRPNGKIHRIYPDGQIPKDNPFYDHEGSIKSIFSYGNRNPQGLAIHPISGLLWETEHGPFGGDELNLLSSGKNYGWPVITYGRNYNGTPITDIERKTGMEQPNLYWKPSIAVCGLDFYRGDLFPKWNNQLLVGALKYEEVQLLNIDQDRVIHRETILKNAGRVRDVCSGPDGAIYVVLNSPGAVIRLSPK